MTPPRRRGGRAGLPIRETDLQRLVLDAAARTGWLAAHFRPVQVRRRDGSVYHATPVAADGKGFPDLVLVNARRGRIVFAELKAEGGSLEPEQKVWRDAIIGAADGERVRWELWRPRDADHALAILAGLTEEAK